MTTADTDLTGARLDAAVEMAIFGGDVIQQPNTLIWGYRWNGSDSLIDTKSIPAYSESLDAAWRIVRKLREQGYDFMLSITGKDLWICYFATPAFTISHKATAETAAVAICRAALKAADDGPH